MQIVYAGKGRYSAFSSFQGTWFSKREQLPEVAG